MIKNNQLAWDQILKPDALRTNLILASLYTAYYEILKDAIITRIKNYLYTDLSKDGVVVSNKYQIEVIARNKSPLYASLSWLKDKGVIDLTDLEIFEQVKLCRNELAHELKDLITKGIELKHLKAFRDLVYLLEKIELWWIVNVEIPTNPDLAGNEINKSRIIPGTIMGLQLLLDVALGDEELSRFYYDEFTKRNL